MDVVIRASAHQDGETMTAKQFLSQAYRLDKRIERRTEDIARMRARMEKATAQLTGMPRGGSGGDWTDVSIRVLEYEASVKAEIAELCRVKRLIREAIDAVEDARYRELLELRYIVGMRWERIAVEMNYSFDRIKHMHGEALRAVNVPSEFSTQ